MKIKYTHIIAGFLSVFFFENSFSQVSTHTIQHNGLMREYDLYVPSIYDGNESVPVVFNLHGYTSNKEGQTVYGDFRAIADTANFIIVHPNGTFDPSNERWWNVDGVISGPDDVGFLVSLVSELDLNYNIDLNKVYSTGMSNGGFMSFELACEASEVFTAVASVTGSMPINKPNNCEADYPVPAMQIHGTADLVVPYNGSAQLARVEDVVSFWVSQVQANPTPIQTNLPDLDPNDGSTVEHYLYEGGLYGSSAEHYKVINGGHTWPGSAITLTASGSTNQDFNASIEIWRFFSQFSKENLLSSEDHETFDISIYPNPSNGEFTLTLPAGEKAIIIHDFMGRKIEDQTASGESMTFRLDQGVYLIRIIHNGNSVTKKLVVQ